jgi:hypothetical protein
MTRLETARSVATQLFKVEDAIDAAIGEAARLTLAVTEARGGLRLAAVVGGEVFDRAAGLHAQLAAARAEAAALHEALAEVRDRLRMDGDDFGSFDKPPKRPDYAQAEGPPAVARRLRTV